jgi:hypothetical protein
MASWSQLEVVIFRLDARGGAGRGHGSRSISLLVPIMVAGSFDLPVSRAQAGFFGLNWYIWPWSARSCSRPSLFNRSGGDEARAATYPGRVELADS